VLWIPLHCRPVCAGACGLGLSAYVVYVYVYVFPCALVFVAFLRGSLNANHIYLKGKVI